MRKKKDMMNLIKMRRQQKSRPFLNFKKMRPQLHNFSLLFPKLPCTTYVLFQIHYLFLKEMLLYACIYIPKYNLLSLYITIYVCIFSGPTFDIGQTIQCDLIWERTHFLCSVFLICLQLFCRVSMLQIFPKQF